MNSLVLISVILDVFWLVNVFIFVTYTGCIYRTDCQNGESSFACCHKKAKLGLLFVKDFFSVLN